MKIWPYQSKQTVIIIDSAENYLINPCADRMAISQN